MVARAVANLPMRRPLAPLPGLVLPFLNFHMQEQQDPMLPGRGQGSTLANRGRGRRGGGDGAWPAGMKQPAPAPGLGWGTVNRQLLLARDIKQRTRIEVVARGVCGKLIESVVSSPR